MSAYATDLEVFNAALMRQGQRPLEVASTNRVSQLYSTTYTGVVRFRMRRHKFGFCRKESLLARSATVVRDGYWAYELPADNNLVHAVFTKDDRLIRRRDILGRDIVIPYDSDEIYMLHTFLAPVTQWSDDFAEVIVQHCEALICKALLEDTQMFKTMMDSADNLLLETIARDKYENPPEKWIVTPGLARHVRRSNRRASAI